jgi:hypothetical protein
MLVPDPKAKKGERVILPSSVPERMAEPARGPSGRLISCAVLISTIFNYMM